MEGPTIHVLEAALRYLHNAMVMVSFGPTDRFFHGLKTVEDGAECFLFFLTLFE